MRLVSDVPLRLFLLSGGVDSSAVTALQCRPRLNGKDFFDSFAESSFDESSYARSRESS